jgi:hypothetical protein
MREAHKENKQINSTASYSKFDFENICAGVLYIIENPVHVDRLHPYLKADAFFEGDNNIQVRALRIIVNKIQEIRKNDGIGCINTVYMSAKLQQVIDSEDNTAAQNLFNSMISDPKIIARSRDKGCQNLFLDFIKALQIIGWANHFAPKWKSGDMESATQSMKELTSTIDKIKFRAIEEAVDLAAMKMDELLGYIGVSAEQKGELFYIGNKGIDNAIGGFERRALHIFIGPTNSGKSMMTHHLIARSIEQKMSVHIAVVEDRPKSFVRRLLANLTGIEINRLKFQSNSLSAQEKQSLLDAQASIGRYVKIDFCYDEGLESIHQKKAEYDAERVAKGLLPYDVDIVDYTGHIAVKAAGDKTYEKYRNAFAERKNFCLVNNKIGFDAAQVNREGFKKKEQNVSISHGDLAGSYDLSQVCDNIIAIYRTPDSEQNNDVNLVITKVKDGMLSRDGYTVGENFKCARWDMMKHNGVKATEISSTIRVNDDTKERGM